MSEENNELVSKVIDQNILVYDCDAQPGEFTKLFYYLAKDVLRNNPQIFTKNVTGNIKAIMSDVPLPGLFTQSNPNIDFICDPDLLNEFYKQRGAIQSEDKHIAIFVDECDSVLVGSY